jgi:hypothetical protein
MENYNLRAQGNLVFQSERECPPWWDKSMKNWSGIWPIREFPRSSSVEGQKTRAVVGVRIVTTKIGVRHNPPSPRRVDNSRTQYGVAICLVRQLLGCYQYRTIDSNERLVYNHRIEELRGPYSWICGPQLSSFVFVIMSVPSSNLDIEILLGFPEHRGILLWEGIHVRLGRGMRR